MRANEEIGVLKSYLYLFRNRSYIKLNKKNNYAYTLLSEDKTDGSVSSYTKPTLNLHRHERLDETDEQ